MFNKSFLGIDIGSNSIKAVEIVKTGRNQFKVERLGRIAMPKNAVVSGEIIDKAAVQNSLKELIKALKPSTSKAVIAITSKSVITRSIRMPIMTMNEIEESLKYEVERYIPMSLDDIIYDFSDAGVVEADGGKQQQVMLVAAPKKEIYGLYEFFKQAGVNPIAIETPAFALWRLYCIVASAAEDTFACLDMGNQTSTIIIFKEKKPHFIRQIPLGGQHIWEAITASMGAAFDEAAASLESDLGFLPNNATDNLDPEAVQRDMLLRAAFGDFVHEIRRSMDFYRMQSRDASISRLILCGGLTKINGIDDFFASEFAMEVSVGKIAPLVDKHKIADSIKEKLSPDMAVAIGLALREVFV